MIPRDDKRTPLQAFDAAVAGYIDKRVAERLAKEIPITIATVHARKRAKASLRDAIKRAVVLGLGTACAVVSLLVLMAWVA